MRKFRNAALAAATATAVAFGGTAIADAQETVNGTSSSFTSGWKQPGDAKFGDVAKELSSKDGSSKAGKLTGKDESTKLTDVFGTKVNDEDASQWARIWRDAINWFALATGIGIIIGAANWALHEGYLPQIPFNF